MRKTSFYIQKPHTQTEKRVIKMCEIKEGNSREILKEIPANSYDAAVTDPPYGLGKQPDARTVFQKWLQNQSYEGSKRGFMGAEWDAFVPDPEIWEELFRILKPGAYATVFSGTRTLGYMIASLMLGGFEIRDIIMYCYNNGFPKSMNVSQKIDHKLGAQRKKMRVAAKTVRNPKVTKAGKDGRKGATRPWMEKAFEVGYHEKDDDEPVTDEARTWQGYGTNLKPAFEPIILCRKPPEGSIAENILKWGCGSLNIDGCRIFREAGDRFKYGRDQVLPHANNTHSMGKFKCVAPYDPSKGRWPANLMHDDSPDVASHFPVTGPSRVAPRGGSSPNPMSWGKERKDGFTPKGHEDEGGSASRFYFSAKVAPGERNFGMLGEENDHPTLKPVALMSYLLRLITPPGGKVIDPFVGSGTTVLAAIYEKAECMGIELDPHYAKISRTRTQYALSNYEELARLVLEGKARRNSLDESSEGLCQLGFEDFLKNQEQ